jgi:hypothetical protein
MTHLLLQVLRKSRPLFVIPTSAAVVGHGLGRLLGFSGKEGTEPCESSR